MHLIKAPSGIFHFRMKIPLPAQPYYQYRTEIKRSLMTKKKRIAQPLANKLYNRNKEAISCVLLEFANGCKVTIDQPTPEMEARTAKTILDAAHGGQTSKPAMNLSDLVEQYLPDTKNSVTHRTQTERTGALRAYTSISNTIDQESANRFSDILKNLPPNFKKDDILEQSKQTHKKVISIVTHNKYIGFLGAFNNWLVNRGASDKNFFSGLKMKKGTQAHEERLPYTPEEITLLLKEISRLEGFKYWLPLLGLYTGSRLNELSQLYLEDVTEVDGILCLNITDKRDDQHLKNLASRRLVPIHEGIAQEFKDYLDSLNGDRVFPELTWTKSSFYGGKSSKWFNERFKEKIGLKPTFHALRHTFASSLLSKGVDSRVISELLGHASPGETGRYTGKRNPKILLEAVSLLEFH